METTTSRSEAYDEARARIIGLVDDSVADREVPACPGWSVKDVVAHLSGSLAAYASGDMKDASSPEWGETQVKARADTSLEDCFEEWARNREEVGDLFDSTLGAVALADVLSHEQDIRGALGRPGARDEPHLAGAIGMGLSFLGQKLESAGVAPVRFVTEDIDETVGEGAPAATLRTTNFELLRVLHGRRSPTQTASLDWEGDPTPYLDTIPLFGPTERDIVE